MIVSAVSLWKKLDTTNPLSESVWGEYENETGAYANVTYYGHKVDDGSVRIYANFARPRGTGKVPAVLLLQDAGKETDLELLEFFVSKGYAVLAPDYCGKMRSDSGNTRLPRSTLRGTPALSKKLLTSSTESLLSAV